MRASFVSFGLSTWRLRNFFSTAMSAAQAQSISARLTTVSENNKSTLRLIDRLGKINFQAGSVPLDGDASDIRVELSSEIHDTLKQQEQEFQLLKQEVEDTTAGAHTGAKRRESERDREKTRLNIQVARLGEDLKQYGSYHKA